MKIVTPSINGATVSSAAPETPHSFQSEIEELQNLKRDNPTAFVDRIKHLLDATMTQEVDRRDYYIHELSTILPEQSEEIADVVVNELKLSNFSDTDRQLPPKESDRVSRLEELFFSAEKDKEKLLTGILESSGLIRNPTLKQQLLETFNRQYPEYANELEHRAGANLIVPVENGNEDSETYRVPSSSQKILHPPLPPPADSN